MSSGIYKLTFSDGTFYIGKSNDIERRWGQHSKNLGLGKHAVKLQLAYNRCGNPEYSVMILCHEDHLDTLEGILINANWNDQILNTTRPKIISEIEWEALQFIPAEMWMNGPIHNLTQIKNLKDYITELKQDLEEAEEAFEETLADIKSGTRLEYAEDRVNSLKQDNANLLHNTRILKDQIERIQNRGIFARLFNL